MPPFEISLATSLTVIATAIAGRGLAIAILAALCRQRIYPTTVRLPSLQLSEVMYAIMQP